LNEQLHHKAQTCQLEVDNTKDRVLWQRKSLSLGDRIRRFVVLTSCRLRSSLGSQGDASMSAIPAGAKPLLQTHSPLHRTSWLVGSRQRKNSGAGHQSLDGL